MKDTFRFKQFAIEQQRCAMKVGTDGVLLGAWAQGGQHMLDVGTGTGVIALMLAQRYPEASMTAIDLDADAVEQARQNISASPFTDRIEVQHDAVQHFAEHAHEQGRYDAIVSNPPFFIDALKTPNRQRTMARHAVTLTYEQLAEAAARLLSDAGELSVIVPSDYRRRMDDAALFARLFPYRVCAVSTKEEKPPRRYLLSYTKHPRPLEVTSLTIGSEPYRALTDDFYL